MDQFFLICATIGGTILVLRLALSLLGFGFEHADLDIGGIGDAHLDAGHDFAHGGLDHADDGGLDHADQGGTGHSHLSNLGRIFTFQAIVSFLAFFGDRRPLGAGGEAAPAVAVLIGPATGFVAVFLLGYALRSLRRLRHRRHGADRAGRRPERERSTCASQPTAAARARSRCRSRVGPSRSRPARPAPSCGRRAGRRQPGDRRSDRRGRHARGGHRQAGPLTE